MIAVLVRPLITAALKELVGRSRPALDPVVTAHGLSFPSGHAMGVATVWLALPAVVAAYGGSVESRRIAGIVAGVVVVAVAASRVYLGVHWTTDVIAGAVGGAALLMTIARLADRVDRTAAQTGTR
jgi:undecaprenyl-diphosphatase